MLDLMERGWISLIKNQPTNQMTNQNKKISCFYNSRMELSEPSYSILRRKLFNTKSNFKSNNSEVIFAHFAPCSK